MNEGNEGSEYKGKKTNEIGARVVVIVRKAKGNNVKITEKEYASHMHIEKFAFLLVFFDSTER